MTSLLWPANLVLSKALPRLIAHGRHVIAAGALLTLIAASDPAAGEDPTSVSGSADAGQEMLDDLNRDAEALSKAAEKHLESTTERSEALGELAKSIDFLMTQLDEAHADNARLRARILGLTDELERARAGAVIQEAESGDAAANAASQQKLDALAARAEADAVRIEELTTEVAALKNVESSLSSELREAQARLGDAESTIAARDAQLKGASESASRLSALEQENAALDQQLSNAVNERQNAASRDAEQQKKIAALQQQLAGAVSERQSSESRDAEQQQRIAALEEQLQALQSDERDLSERAARAAELDEEAAALKSRLTELGAALEASEIASATHEIKIAELTTQLEETKALGQQAEAQGKNSEELEQRIRDLEAELLGLSAIVKTSEAKVGLQQRQLAALESKPKDDAATRFAELKRYRSEFFGRLRQVLGEQRDAALVGDSYIFQADALFEAGSAELNDDATVPLSRLADTLRALESQIPGNLPWVLRIDGHTDRASARSAEFGSNRELSSARAQAVTNFLISKGVSAPHLAATGFGEHRPIDPRDDEIAQRRNRRIEFRLTPP